MAAFYSNEPVAKPQYLYAAAPTGFVPVLEQSHQLAVSEKYEFNFGEYCIVAVLPLR